MYDISLQEAEKGVEDAEKLLRSCKKILESVVEKQKGKYEVKITAFIDKNKLEGFKESHSWERKEILAKALHKNDITSYSLQDMDTFNEGRGGRGMIKQDKA